MPLIVKYLNNKKNTILMIGRQVINICTILSTNICKKDEKGCENDVKLNLCIFQKQRRS